jgi:hypothetical protein
MSSSRPVVGAGTDGSRVPLPNPASEHASTSSKEEFRGKTFSGGGSPHEQDVALITFDDLKTEMAADSLFQPSLLPEKVKKLDGRRVRIRGFIFPAIFQQKGIQSFPLIKNTQCKFGPGGQAHHIILVDLVEGLTTSFTVRPIAVEGRLRIKPWEGPDGNTWALYHMVGESVE